MATTATTTTYQYPYPLGGDSLSNVATRIKELADRSETVTAQIIAGNITLAPGTIYNASIAATAGITYGKLSLANSITNADLAGSIAPSKITGTAITAADTGTVTGTMIASSVALAGNPTTTTQAQSNNSTRVATTAYVDSYITGTVPDDSLTNVKINSAAAIAYSKLNLATSIVNADVSASAAIAYSKLNLAASVTSADIVSVKQSQISDFVFTTETARDAAITAPTEGMRAYLTAPVNIAVTGDTYAPTPTGIQTIYNGSKWVCVTPLSGSTDTQGTILGGGFSPTLTSGGTNPTVKLETGTSALITVSARISNATATNAGEFGISVSGATTLAAVSVMNINCPFSNVSHYTHIGRTYTITGLTGGVNTFTLEYNGNGGTTFSRRSLTVQGIA